MISDLYPKYMQLSSSAKNEQIQIKTCFEKPNQIEVERALNVRVTGINSRTVAVDEGLGLAKCPHCLRLISKHSLYYHYRNATKGKACPRSTSSKSSLNKY